MRRALLVAKRDYLAAVKNKGFLIGLVIAPLLFGGGGFAMTLLSRPDTKGQRIAIVDRTGVAAEAVVRALEERNAKDMFEKVTGKQLMPRYTFETPRAREDADAQRLALSDRVRRGDLSMFIEIGEDVADPKKVDSSAGTSSNCPIRALCPPDPEAARRQVVYYTNSGGFNELRRWFDGPVNQALRGVRLKQLGVDPDLVKDALANVPAERMNLVSRDAKSGKIMEPKRRNELESFVVPFVLMFLLMMIVMVGSSPMLGAVAEDKMQRVYEMLLVSATPFELMMGKVLAALGASLTSSVFYILGGILVLQGLALTGLVPFALLPWFFVYLVADVMMLSAMAAGLGASCSTPQDAQHLAIFLVAPVVIPAMSILPLLQAPNGVFATAMSLIPPFTPMVMLLRQALPGGVPAWQPWAGLVGVVACTFGITWAAARIFRVGILSQGKLPKMGELVRWAARG